MKTFIFVALLFIATVAYSHQVNNAYVVSSLSISNSVQKNQNNSKPIIAKKHSGKMTPFWIAFVVGAIGVYSIYGFAAGIIAVAVTYFATNGNKKAFVMSIWGCLAGMALGALIRFVIL